MLARGTYGIGSHAISHRAPAINAIHEFAPIVYFLEGAFVLDRVKSGVNHLLKFGVL